MVGKILIFFGFLCLVFGDKYDPRDTPAIIVRPIYHPTASTVRDHYHPKDSYNPERTYYHKTIEDEYHPRSKSSPDAQKKPFSPSGQLKDHYHPKDPYHPDRVDHKIIGGSETTIEELPYQTSLRTISTHTCGAAILDERTAITAAHCVHGRSNSFTLWSGTTFINDRTHPGVLSFVNNIIIHEGYNATSQDNDIAILKLFQPLKFSDRIKPIQLADKWGGGSLQDAVVSGWGRTQENIALPKGPIALRKATVSVISRAECEKRYPNALTGSMICAHAPGRDSCQGDSGGPLVANNKLVGVVSWGYGCGRPDYPGVYTSVAKLRDWIQAHIEH